MRSICRLFALRAALAVTAALAGFSDSAHAEYIIDVSQMGSNVVATGSGSLNLTGLTFAGSISILQGGAIDSPNDIFNIGTGSTADIYEGLSGSGSFGGNATAQLNTGPYIGAQGIDGGFLSTPTGYVSGQAVGTSTSTYVNATIAELGLKSGTYTYALPDDSLVIDIASTATTTVPEPLTLSIFGAGLTGVIAARRRKRKAI